MLQVGDIDLSPKADPDSILELYFSYKNNLK